MRQKINMKKANAIIEYGIVLMVVVAAMAGIQSFLRRNIHARIKYESDSELQHGQGLEWDASITSESSINTFDRYETPGGTIIISSDDDTSSVTYSPPMPPYIMEHKGSSIHIQDAAQMPPKPDNPDQGRSQRSSDGSKYPNGNQQQEIAPMPGVDT
jgi:hypothetical protein